MHNTKLIVNGGSINASKHSVFFLRFLSKENKTIGIDSGIFENEMKAKSLKSGGCTQRPCMGAVKVSAHLERRLRRSGLIEMSVWWYDAGL
jgi:hypothetical protein